METEEQIKYKKILEKGMTLLKDNPNAIIDIIQVATRLSYLRGRIFEQEKLNSERIVSASKNKNGR